MIKELIKHKPKTIRIINLAFSLAISIHLLLIYGCAIYYPAKAIDLKTLDYSRHSIVIGRITGTGSNSHWIVLHDWIGTGNFSKLKEDGKAFELIYTKGSPPSTPWFKRLSKLLEDGYYFIAVPPGDYVLYISVNPNTLLNPYKSVGATDRVIRFNVPPGSLINSGTITLVGDDTYVKRQGLGTSMTITYHYQTGTDFDQVERYFQELYPDLYKTYYPKLLRIQ